MEHTSEAVDPLAVVRQRVQELRRRKNWSAAELGDHLAAAGVPWNRSIVANFENGRRPSVSIQELFGLARVLDVAPTHLLVPLADVPYEVTPGQTVTAADARAWIAGAAPLPGTDRRIYFSEVPAVESHPAGRAAVELLAEVTELAARAEAGQIVDDFPFLFPKIEASLERVAAEVRRIRVRYDQQSREILDTANRSITAQLAEAVRADPGNKALAEMLRKAQEQDAESRGDE